MQSILPSLSRPSALVVSRAASQRRIHPWLLGLLLTGAFAKPTFATTYTWNGGSTTTSNFSDGANWGGTAPVATGNPNDLIFAGATRLTPVVDTTNSAGNPAGFFASSITFGSTAGSFNIGGSNNIRLTGAPSIVQNSASDQTITTGLSLGSSGSVAMTLGGTGTGNLTLNTLNVTTSGATGDSLNVGHNATINTINNTSSTAAFSIGFNAVNTSLVLGTISGSISQPVTISLGLSTGTTTYAGTSFSSSASADYSATANVRLDSGTFAGTNSNAFNNLTIFGTADKTITVSNTGGTTFKGTAQLGSTDGAASRTVTASVGTGASLTLTTVSGSASTGTTSLTKSGAGLLTITGAGSFNGTTTVSGGTLIAGASGATTQALGGTTKVVISAGSLTLAAANQINAAAPMTLSGGTFNTGGFSQSLGALTLSSTSTVDLGNGASILAFANSNGTWTGTLNVYNWTGSTSGGGTDQVFFGNSAAGLSAAQLAQIEFFSGAGTGDLGAARILSTGEIVPVAVPEPGTGMAAVLLLGLLGGMKSLRRLVGGQQA